MFIAQNTPFWKCQKVSLKQHQKLHIPMAQDGFNFHHETKRDTDLFLCIMLILINLISRNTLTRDVYPHKPTNSDCSTRCLSTLWWDFAVCCTFSTCRKHQEQHWHSKKLIELLIYIYGLLLFYCKQLYRWTQYYKTLLMFRIALFLSFAYWCCAQFRFLSENLTDFQFSTLKSTVRALQMREDPLLYTFFNLLSHYIKYAVSQLFSSFMHF